MPDGSQKLNNKVVISEDCPVRSLLDRIADKWSLLVIIRLSEAQNSKRRFSELKRDVEGISQRMLTSTLRQLERDGLVTREIFAEVPPRVEYQLAPLGHSFLAPAKTLIDWMVNKWPEIELKREAYDNKVAS